MGSTITSVPLHRLLVSVAALALPLLGLATSGCSQDPTQRAGMSDGSGDTGLGGHGGTTDQPSSNSCADHHAGCPCDTEGQHLICGKVVAKINNQTMCGQGVSVCTQGKWDECILTGADPIPIDQAPDGYYKTEGLGNSIKCADNPCDPYCFHYPDTPDGNAVDAGTGLNLTDGGLGTIPDAGTGTCTAKTCSQLGKNCGPVANGCGATIDCGTCSGGLTCGGGGTPNVCGTFPVQPCAPTTCAALGKNCGPMSDGCGGVLGCGTCSNGQTCGGGGIPSVCGTYQKSCTPKTCSQLGKNCGPVADGCGGLLSCGSCTGSQTCGGSGTPSVCGTPTPPGGFCAPKTCAQQGKNCGPMSDGCGGVLQCGSCTSPQFCGGGGVPSVCGGSVCIPKTCDQLGKNCGPVADGCGGLLQCGSCQYPQVCGGGNNPSVCGFGGTCTGLCQQQTYCAGSATTSITGRVFAPNGTDPLPNVIVYVPNAAVPAFSEGISCDNCAQVQGSPLVSTKTATDGTFTISNMPVGNNIPLVIQIGRWRRQVTIPNVAACTNTTVSADLTRFPRNKSEGDIPKMAISTGSVDTMECVLRKMGIQDSEFTGPTSNGRIHLYAGGYSPGARSSQGTWGSAGTPWESALLGTPSKMDDYDMILFPCQGGRFAYNSGHSTYQGNIANYVNAGGRIFSTHYSYVWLYTGGVYSSSLSPAINWNLDNYASDGTFTGYINTGFSRGAQLASWLQLPQISASSTYGQIPVSVIRQDYNSVNSPTINWMSLGANNTGIPIHLTFDTPRTAPAASQCGRVVFSDFHVENSSYYYSQTTFPGECPGGGMNAQEKLLEYMLFDLASCVGDPPSPATCSPRTCAQLGVTCGQTGDGCGNVITCGGACPTSTCTPTTCAAQALSCGTTGNGCGGTLDCGTCTGGQTCGGGGVPGQCGSPPPCIAGGCLNPGVTCGQQGNGCGGQVTCGCNAPATCGGGGVPGQCGTPPSCVPSTCPNAGVTCGQTGDGCGGTLNCGCNAPATCGGAGVLGQCGVKPTCTPTTCAAQGITCGQAGDGCGGVLSCGTCAAPATCGGGGVPGQCGTVTVYDDGYFVRDYEMKCPSGTAPFWQLWSWTAMTPNDSSIDFSVRTATTKAGLDTAPSDPLLFSVPPGPSALVGLQAKAHAANQPPGSPDTQSGAASVDSTLLKAGRQRNNSYLRVTSHLAPALNKYSGPVLSSWDMQVDCIPSE